MHIVVLAWLYVLFAMALTAESFAAGAALFLLVGVAPVAAWVALRVRRLRARGVSAGGRARRRSPPPPAR